MNDAMVRIAKRLTGLVAKRPGLVVGIWGEPGIGKTHTIKQLLRETPCRNLSFHATTSPTDIARVLPRPTKLPVRAERTLERIVKGEHVEIATLTDVIGASLNGLAPFVLHLEDIHEASPTQLEFVQALAKIVTRLKGVGLIVTSREQPPEGFEALRLEPLSSQTVKGILQAEVSADLPTEALDWLQTRAAGNPLFSLEFFRYLSRQGFLWSDGQRWRWRKPSLEIMPVSVEALIEQIVAKATLTSTLEMVVQAKAMLGRDTDLTLWAALANVTLEILEASKTELEREGILFGHEFAHPLYAELVDLHLAPEKRQLLARRALEVLENSPEVIAQFVQVANLEPLQAIKLLETAATEANVLHNSALEGRLLVIAVDYTAGEEKGSLAFRAALCLKQVNEQECLELLKQAIALLPDNLEAIYINASVLASRGNFSEAEAALYQMPQPEKKSLRWLENAIDIRALVRDGKGIIHLWETHLEHHQNFNCATLIKVAMSLIWVQRTKDALSFTLSLLERTDLELKERDELRYIAGICYHHLDDPKTAIGLFQESISYLRSEQLQQRLVNVLNACSSALSEINERQAAFALSKEALLVASGVGNPLSYACAQYILAEHYIAFGEYAKAEELLLESQTALKRFTPMGALVDCEMYLSDLYQTWDSAHSPLLAHKYATNARTSAALIANQHYLSASLRCLAGAENLVGQPEKGLVLTTEALAKLKHQDQLWDLRETYYVYAQSLKALGRSNEALAGFQEALKAAVRLGELYKVRLIELEIDHLNDDLESARTRMHWFEEHGLMNGVNIARRYFPELANNIARTSKIIQTKLEVFGAMLFVTDTLSLPVRGQKRRELLALLLEARIAGRRELSRLELLDILYPNTDEVQAGALLNNVVYQLRDIGGSSVIVTTENGYALGEITTDAEIFLETGDTRLWRGAYLEGLNLARSNETTLETLHLALQTHAEKLLETNLTEAARVGRLLCEADSYNLEALRLTIKALRAAQNHKTLSRVYNQSREQFLEIGEVLPERWQDFLETPIGITA